MKNHLVGSFFALASFLAIHTNAGAQIVQNGDFADNPGDFTMGYHYSNVNGNATIDDFTESSLSNIGEEIEGDNVPYSPTVFGPPTYNAATDPKYFAFVQHNNTLTQTITLTAGVLYNISFESATRSNTPGDPILMIENPTTSLPQLLFDSNGNAVAFLQGNNVEGTDFTTTTGSFVATSNEKLVLENLDPTGADTTGDFANVSITLPEPTTNMLLGLGVLLLAFTGRRALRNN